MDFTHSFQVQWVPLAQLHSLKFSLQAHFLIPVVFFSPPNNAKAFYDRMGKIYSLGAYIFQGYEKMRKLEFSSNSSSNFSLLRKELLHQGWWMAGWRWAVQHFCNEHILLLSNFVWKTSFSIAKHGWRDDLWARKAVPALTGFFLLNLKHWGNLPSLLQCMLL